MSIKKNQLSIIKLSIIKNQIICYLNYSFDNILFLNFLRKKGFIAHFEIFSKKNYSLNKIKIFLKPEKSINSFLETKKWFFAKILKKNKIYANFNTFFFKGKGLISKSTAKILK